MGNSFGRLFRITTFGESHGTAVGVIVDGCPPRLPLGEADVQRELDRRRPGQSRITTQRKEADQVQILSGVYAGVTLGTSIAMMVKNADNRARDYGEMREKYRPSHADYTYQAKYGIRAVEGGGRASARETVGRVAAGAVAKIVLGQSGIEVLAWVEQVHDVLADVDVEAVTLEAVEGHMVRCPDPAAAQIMLERIEQARKDGDSLGGVVRCIARGVPAGLGSPVFDKLEAGLAAGMLSLPAAKGFEIGSGFDGVTMRGSEHNDAFYADESESGRIRTRTNHSGGIRAGITNGELIDMRVAFKRTATMMREQATVDTQGKDTTLKPRGRHDPCVLPRAVPIVEAMTALVLADHLLLHRGQCGEPADGGSADDVR
jgi:chorismate synthase